MKRKPLTILALESSGRTCSVAISSGDRLRAETFSAARGQAEALLPAIRQTMIDSGLDWPDIDLLAVTVGPGSFTGLRIGLAAARGLALARALPLIGVTTPDLLAHSVPDDTFAGRRLLVAVDSKRDDVFLQLFDSQRQPLTPIESALPRDAIAGLAGPLLVVGDAAAQFENLRPDVEVNPSLPSASALSKLAARRFSEGSGLPAQPLYLRPPDVSLPAGR